MADLTQELAGWEKRPTSNPFFTSSIIEQATYQNGYCLLASALSSLSEAEQCFDDIRSLWEDQTMKCKILDHTAYDDTCHPLDAAIDKGICPTAADGYTALGTSLRRLDAAYSISKAAQAHHRPSSLRRDFEAQLAHAVSQMHAHIWALPPTRRPHFITGAQTGDAAPDHQACMAVIAGRLEMCRSLGSVLGERFWACKWKSQALDTHEGVLYTQNYKPSSLSDWVYDYLRRIYGGASRAGLMPAFGTKRRHDSDAENEAESEPQAKRRAIGTKKAQSKEIQTPAICQDSNSASTKERSRSAAYVELAVMRDSSPGRLATVFEHDNSDAELEPDPGDTCMPLPVADAASEPVFGIVRRNGDSELEDEFDPRPISQEYIIIDSSIEASDSDAYWESEGEWEPEPEQNTRVSTSLLAWLDKALQTPRLQNHVWIV
ncbi:hypothetical protein BROUX41_006589 [Berkeleyomyces rouxiae]|uniref:uncharacterized protein n=1 Tax=Berkeleyomyces rouxiae TaxID=2035830 RepID=UPI003B7D82C5